MEKKGAVALVTLNRPDALNALSHALRKAICRAFMELKDDPDVRAVVLTGAAVRLRLSRPGAARRALRSALKTRKSTLLKHWLLIHGQSLVQSMATPSVVLNSRSAAMCFLVRQMRNSPTRMLCGHCA